MKHRISPSFNVGPTQERDRSRLLLLKLAVTVQIVTANFRVRTVRADYLTHSDSLSLREDLLPTTNSPPHDAMPRGDE